MKKRVPDALKALIAAVLVTVIMAISGLNGVDLMFFSDLKRVDQWLQDGLYQIPRAPSEEIVVIGIDEKALDEFGPYNTWDRSIMAYALAALSADPDNQPAVVAIDVLYAGETYPQIDAYLAQAASYLNHVVTATLATYGISTTYVNGRAVSSEMKVINYETPYEALLEATSQGHINAMYDKDGILRHALLYVQPDGADGERVRSMAFETARLYLEDRGQTLREPTVNEGGHYYVPFSATPGSYYDGVSIADVINGDISPEYWAGKIVLIGPYATGLQDDHPTSIARGTRMFGVEFQANVIQSLIEGNYKTEIPDLPQYLLLFALSFVSMLVFLRLRMTRGLILCAGLILSGFVAPILLYQAGLVTHVLWIPASILMLYIAALAFHYARSIQERHALELEKERISTELAMASRIQSNSLPKVFPAFPEQTAFDLYASMTPAKEVGGDLYDFFMIDQDHLALVIGDVSGKGVPAALFMMLVTALIRSAAREELNPAKVLAAVNGQVCARNPDDMFVTVWMGVLEISTGRLTAANAGHEYPAIKTPGGPFELLKDKHGFVIGGMEGVRYRSYEIQMEPGSKVFVYTDGVAEATSLSEELFGTERMIDALNSAADGTPEVILGAVSGAVDTFVGLAPQFDDLTMLCLTYLGPQ